MDYQLLIGIFGAGWLGINTYILQKLHRDLSSIRDALTQTYKEFDREIDRTREDVVQVARSIDHHKIYAAETFATVGRLDRLENRVLKQLEGINEKLNHVQVQVREQGQA